MIRHLPVLCLLIACDPETSDDPGACDDLGLEVPVPVGEIGGVYDAARQRVVTFGGNAGVPEQCSFSATDFTAETWSYDLGCDAWTQVQTSGGPGARGRYAIAHDVDGGRMVIHGGRTRAGDSGPYTLPDETWSFDLATDTWSQLPAGGPGGLTNHTAVVAQGKVWIHGGNTSTDGAFFLPNAETWTLDLATDTWTQVATTNDPPARLFHAAATDGTTMWVYGGGDENAFFGPFFSDLWALDLASGAWTRLHDGVAGAPRGRTWANLLHDGARGRLLLWAGHDDGNLGNTNQVWAFDLGASTWSQLREGDVFANPPAGVCDFPADFTTIDPASPERRQAGAAMWGADGQLLVVGGKTDCGNINDVWQFDPAAETWTERFRATAGEVCIRGAEGCETMCF